MSRIIHCTQGDDLWCAARVGRITGSNIDALLAPPTTRQSTRKGVVCPAGTEALEYAEYRQKLIVERIYGRAVNNVTTQYMKDGSDREPFARMIYEAEVQMPVELVGFALHPLWDWFGASPDGLAGEDGGVELKCPRRDDARRLCGQPGRSGGRVQGAGLGQPDLLPGAFMVGSGQLSTLRPGLTETLAGSALPSFGLGADDCRD